MGMTSLIEALVFLMVAVIVLFIVMTIWQPITSDNLYPLLENAEAFGSNGAVAVTLLQIFPLAVVAALFLAFFGHIMRGDRPQQPVGF